MKGKSNNLKNIAVPKVLAATALLVPLAAFLGAAGKLSSNHNETFLCDA
jgi:hypothetical protein